MTQSPAEVPAIDVLEASRRLAAGALLIDCREQEEHREVRVANVPLVPLSVFAETVQDVLGEQREVMVLCRSGQRSARATAYLREQGIEAVNVAGGILAWQAADLPVERG